MTSTLNVPKILTPGSRAQAVEHLRRYFGPVDGTSGWAGSRFERLAGGGDRPDVADRFTADDLVAVSLLSVNVPPHGAIQLLESRADELARLLAEIPHDLELVDVESIPDDWAPNRLWAALRDVRGIGWVTAGKLLARKRPRLIPVYDSVVQEAVTPTASFWEALRAALRADDRALHRHLLSLRDEAGIGDDISALRVFDVVVWMQNRYLDPTADAEAA
ncbi:DUF6308 family protein [Cellulosimicrobium sp. Marseille-Q4280]|uniref:DUF6308 family protein n=1 Tax=Cellulosimicrobium sp. Marseille-Q4280 TaxID=2937992 RepID=UPI00203EF122|nr:DUF6308 family protein [Cellulosimicrobium sp. Marseille-Q4280]